LLNHTCCNILLPIPHTNGPFVPFKKKKMDLLLYCFLKAKLYVNLEESEGAVSESSFDTCHTPLSHSRYLQQKQLQNQEENESSKPIKKNPRRVSTPT
jgi:hypothetical protein